MNNFIPLIKKFVLSRVGSSIIGLVALCSLIWFAAPMLGITSIAVRLLLIVSVLLLTLLGWLLRWWLIQRRGAVLKEQLQTQRESIAGRQLEIAVLKEKMDDAINALKTSELGVSYRGSAALYALPWYMVIGPAAAGKSTLLRNSGLHFPFSSHEDIRVKGYGGTRNCDWWFADEAILLDTAGRYTTEDDDREEWSTFLTLIKKYRPRLPINGILVVLSLVDLLTADAEGLKWHVKVIRERITEMTHSLGYIFPVYIIFTKIDLVQGFDTFFAHLSETERKQVWGVNFADVASHNDKAEYFKNQLQALYVRLNQFRFSRLSLESDVNRKMTIMDFPQQFLAGAERLKTFIPLLFKENPYQETPNFSGVYFTSGAQEGTVIKYLTEGLATKREETFSYTDMKIAATEAQYRSYFIRDLFSEVVFRNKDMATKSQQTMLTLRWLKSASIVMALGTVVGAVLLYSTSLTSNILLVRQGADIADQLSSVLTQNNMNLSENMTAISQSYDYVANLLSYRDDIPLHLRLGLYRGNDLVPDLSAMITAGLTKFFLVPTAQYLETQLQQDIALWQTAIPEQQHDLRGDYYTTLKVYLMLGEPQHMDAELATDVLSDAWSKAANLPVQPLRGMVHFYVTQPNRQKWAINNSLVEAARAQLYSPTNVSNLYAQIRTKGLDELGVVSAKDLVATDDLSLFTSSNPIPEMFTEKGWEQYGDPEIQRVASDATRGDWVMGHLQQGSPEKTSAIAAQIRELYFADYRQAWFQFLMGIQIKPFASLNQAANQLTVLADNKGPLAQLILAIHDNSEVADPDLYQATAPDSDGKLNKATSAYLKQLLTAKSDLERLAVSPDVGRDAQNYAAQLLSGNGSSSALYAASINANALVTGINDPQTQQGLQNVLLSPLRAAWEVVLQQATSGLQQQWQTQVMSVYQQTLANQFPFAANGDDANMSDITRFLQPNNGVLWQFVNQNLLPFLAPTENGWQQRTWLGVGAGFSSPFLQALTSAKNISDSLFADNGASPAFTLELYPEPTPGLREISVTTNGQTYRYANGPQEWQKLHWPGEEPNNDSVLEIATAKGDGHADIEVESVWGFFKLVQQADLALDSQNAIRATWNLHADNGHHYRVSFLVRDGEKHNLFKELFMDHFQLPNQLFNYQSGG